MWDAGGVDFGLFYAHATRVEICLFGEQGKRETARVELREYADEIGAATCAESRQAQFHVVVPLLGTYLHALIPLTSLSPSSSL